jgi:hypothetical protein
VKISTLLKIIIYLISVEAAKVLLLLLLGVVEQQRENNADDEIHALFLSLSLSKLVVSEYIKTWSEF